MSLHVGFVHRDVFIDVVVACIFGSPWPLQLSGIYRVKSVVFIVVTDVVVDDLRCHVVVCLYLLRE